MGKAVSPAGDGKAVAVGAATAVAAVRRRVANAYFIVEGESRAGMRSGEELSISVCEFELHFYEDVHASLYFFL